jgi:hypothetical protein
MKRLLLALALLLAIPLPATAQIAYDNCNVSSQANFATSQDVVVTVGSLTHGELLAGVATYNEDPGTVTATDNGVSMTAVTGTNGYFGSVGGFLFRSESPAAGSHTVHFAWTNGVSYVQSVAASYQGVDQTTPIDVGGTAVASGYPGSGAATLTVTTATDNAWMFGMVTKAGFGINSSGSGSATMRCEGNDLAWFDSNADLTPAGSHSMTSNNSLSGAFNALLGTALRKSGAGVGGGATTHGFGAMGVGK